MTWSDSAISGSDIRRTNGDIGRLSYRGRVIEDIVGMDYLEVAYLLLFGHEPDAKKLPSALNILRVTVAVAVELCMNSPLENDYLILLAIEEVFNHRMAEKGKDVWANVEYYKGVVLAALGVAVRAV